jgi:hypothetical protein
VKLITSAGELEKEFKRLLRRYSSLSWATAWASASSPVFKDLLNHKNKIEIISVGIHFYQTHPDFIAEFINNKSVHFVEQPDGTFHPKVYLFENSPFEWEMIIGSANFTNDAFTKNTEASVLISNYNSDFSYKEMKDFIKNCFTQGKCFQSSDLEKYRIAWKNHRQKIKSLSGLYGAKKSGKAKPIYDVPVISRSWNDFIRKVLSEKSHGLARRLRVLEIASELFNNTKHFKDLPGIPNKLLKAGAEDWGYFGSMKGAGVFKKKIIENNREISKALDEIPISGQITKIHYDRFVEHFRGVLPGNYLATATRLLCMKRPDTFICFDSANRSRLCKDFGIVQQEMNYERYWDDIVERIYDSEWWRNPAPRNEIEVQISRSRAAFLDSIYYEE